MTPTEPLDRLAIGGGPVYRHHSFDRFQVGDCNREAVKVCRAVAAPLGRWPLVILGACGDGKSHLAEAVLNLLLDRDAAARASSVSSERFGSELRHHRAQGQALRFQEWYGSLDGLYLGSIDWAACDESFAAGVLPVFRALMRRSVPVIVSTCTPPCQIVGAVPALQRFLSGGTQVRLGKPDAEHRRRIIGEAALDAGYRVAPEILRYLADRCDQSVRQLCGALSRAWALAMLRGTEVTLDIAAEVAGG